MLSSPGRRRPGGSGEGVAGLAGGGVNRTIARWQRHQATLRRRDGLRGLLASMKRKAMATSHPGISDFTALKAAYAQATASMTKNVDVASFRAWASQSCSGSQTPGLTRRPRMPARNAAAARKKNAAPYSMATRAET